MQWWVRGVCLVAELKRLVFFDQLRRKRAPPRKFPVTARPNAGLVRAVTMKALSVSPQNPHGNARLDGGMVPSLPGFYLCPHLSTIICISSFPHPLSLEHAISNIASSLLLSFSW